jgi:hypothetical protein
MTLELLATIAALCTLNSSGPLFPIKHEQLKCQKEYLRCVGSRKHMSQMSNKSDAEGQWLAQCIAERQS